VTISRFNLAMLRAFTPKSKATQTSSAASGFPLSRRSFLALSGAGAAFGAVPRFFRGEGFDLVRDGYRLHFCVGDKRCWTIDPAVFGEQAHVDVARESRGIAVSLRHAVFPGTHLPADFICKLVKENSAWVMRLVMDCGIEASSPLLNWLLGRTVAVGSLKTLRFAPFDELSVTFQSLPSVRFTPDWIFEISASSVVTLRGLAQSLPSSGLEILLNSATVLSGVPPERSTTIVVPRNNKKWKVDLFRQNETGWTLDHERDEPLFDELRVEASHTNAGILRSALLMQSADNQTTLNFQPGGVLCTDCGESFSMPLQNPRMAFSLEDEFHSALVADLKDEPTWAHDNNASYLFAKSVDEPFFELHEGPGSAGMPQISPGICEVCFPSDDVCMNLKLGVPRPARFTWADFFSPFQRFAGWLHLVPTRDHNGRLYIDLQKGDALRVDRPRDMLSLQFHFENMRLVTGAFPRIVHVDESGESRVSIVFPPQHVAEEAFFHTDGVGELDVPIGTVERDDYADKPTTPTPTIDDLKKILDGDLQNSTGDDSDKDLPQTKVSGDTHLVFGLPRRHYAIPCQIDALLNWTDWLPLIAPVAQSKVDTNNTARLPKIVSPEPYVYTSIELPYRLNLSPSELGRWAHSIKAVESPKKVVELWHTRLGVLPKLVPGNYDNARLVVDEANTADRTIRAIWSPDFQPVDFPSCTSEANPKDPKFPPHYPDNKTDIFRMSLDGRDRCELVHLTSNYAITQQAHFCDDNQSIPSDPKFLLPPAPVKVERLMLTSMGGYLQAFGEWNPAKVDMNHQFTIQMWKHTATLGRDHYVKVVYKGYLAPFGLRASLVKVTQRVFRKNSKGNWVAILHQLMYIVVKNERRQFPVLGHPFAGREFHFSCVEPVTLVTPFLNDPSKQHWPRDCSRSQSQSLFWPMVPSSTPPLCVVTPPEPPGSIFKFRLRFTDITGIHSAEASMPLLFVASDVAQQDGFGTPPNFASQDAVYFYNRGSVDPVPSGDDPYISANFGGTKFSFAASANTGDTDFETAVLKWRAVPLTATITGKLTNTAPNAFLTFTETISNTTFVQQSNASGNYTIVVDSGSYIVTVTTPQPPPNPALTVSSSVFPVEGNTSYKLDLMLQDATHFISAPVLIIGKDGKGPSPLDLYHYDLPFFFPAVDYARIIATSIKRVTGDNEPKKFNFYPGYLADGFNPATNSGEVILEKSTDDANDTLTLAFGAKGNVDKAGGLASPDTLVVGFSRKTGAVGGTTNKVNGSSDGGARLSVSTFSSGRFDAADFFGGLTSAKLLGAVKLSDIIAPLAPDLASNLEKAPKMLEKALYAAEQFTADATDAIVKFQSLPSNPLASHLSSQAQQVFAARDALVSAKAGNRDALTQALLESQWISRIIDYATALQAALQNPLPLIEDEIIQVLTDAAQNVIGKLSQTVQDALKHLSEMLSDALDKQLQSVLPALAALQTALDNKFTDAITKAEYLLSVLAPDLNNLLELGKLVQSLNGNVTQLGQSIQGIAGPNPPLQQFARIAGDVNTITANLQQIYQKGGFLGVVIGKATAGSPLETAISTARDGLLKLWGTVDYSTFQADVDALQDDCIKLASVYEQTRAQQILQNIRQLQASIKEAMAYRAAVPTDAQSLYRQLQLLQKMQAQILRALSALQSLAQETLPSDLSAPVAAAATNAVNNIKKAVPDLADKLTVSPQLLQVGTAIEQQIAVVAGDADAGKPLKASAVDILHQLVTVRAQIMNDPLNVGLKLLHYNLSLDYQRPLAVALSYIAYVQATADRVLNNLFAIVEPIEKLALQLQQTLCQVQTVWTSFTDTVKGAQNINRPIRTMFGAIIVSQFGDDIKAIDTAFTNLCDPAQITPSEFLRNGQTLVDAFVALENDVRKKIATLPAAVLDALEQTVKQEAQQLLTTLLAGIPIPTSVNLSYTWNPDIQSFEPVFVLRKNAEFKVTASAQAGLNAQLNGVTVAVDIEATLTNFNIQLISDEPFIILVIDKLTFTSHNGSKPDCRLSLNTVEFGSQMQWVRDLAALLNPSNGPFIELADASIRAGFRFAISAITMGAFNLMQLAIEVAVALPFDGTPVRCEFGLSDQQHPFLISSGIFGGGGFLQLQLGLDGVQLLQGALEFGVCAAISIGPLQGSGFVVAGIYFRITKNDAEICGFVHAHGHMDIFGIISMDVDLYVAVCYEKQLNRVRGVATFSVSVSIAFFSETFTMQAEYTFAGSDQKPKTPLLETADKSSEVFLVSPEESSAMALGTNAWGDQGPKPKTRTVCPDASKRELFIDPEKWAKYYNAFA